MIMQKRNEAARLFLGGELEQKEIAKILGVSCVSVCKWLRPIKKQLALDPTLQGRRRLRLELTRARLFDEVERLAGNVSEPTTPRRMADLLECIGKVDNLLKVIV